MRRATGQHNRARSRLSCDKNRLIRRGVGVLLCAAQEGQPDEALLVDPFQDAWIQRCPPIEQRLQAVSACTNVTQSRKPYL